MNRAPAMQRRNFLARALGALAGAWLATKGGRADTAQAQYDQPYLGEIRMFAGDFAPVGWALCNGQLLSVNTYDALFSLIGTTYGGDGQTTFALPDLRGRAPVHFGVIRLGQSSGQEQVEITTTQIPSHSHGLMGGSAAGDASDPAGRLPARNAAGWPHYASSVNTTMASNALATAGSSAPHNNMMPSLCIYFIICIEGGVYPSPT